MSIHCPQDYFIFLNLYRHSKGAGAGAGEGASQHRTAWAGSHSVLKSSFGIAPAHT
jgi:hypothetical protein